jgi:4-hydroxy-2-oxoheptanedioate aldolase
MPVRTSLILALALVALPGQRSQAQRQQRLNPIISLLENKQPVFGLYAPANRRIRPGEAAPATAAPTKTPAELAIEALGNKTGDYVFDGSMEGNFDAAFPTFAEFMKGLENGGTVQKSPILRLHHPVMVKTPEIAPDVAKATDRIGHQLNLGVSGIVFVTVESADEVKAGLAAMRFKSKGGTRADDVGNAPAIWGMSEKEYREKADLWPLNPNGELVNFTIVESKAGLAKVREIAAVKGIGVLFPGAGTLRGVFSTTDANGQRVLDEKRWEGAIQQVLAACKEFNVPCGYPANANDIEMRMQQGFSVFVIGWGEQGFKAVDIGRKVAGRDK